MSNWPDWLPLREELRPLTPYGAPQVPATARMNTNENPYPPSPRVIDAIRRTAEGRLNIYPDPHATAFRRTAAALFNVDPEWILPANGSDENLTIITRSFCDAGQSIGYPYPSYVLYESLAQIQDCGVVRLRLNSQWQWDKAAAAELRRSLRVFYVPNPNSPTGTLWSADQLTELLPEKGVLVLDEAYGDFCSKPHRGELLKDARFENRLVVTRTFSKSYSLAGIRFGFAIAHPSLIDGMRKVKDSYNCDAISIAAATAALEDQAWMEANRQKIIATRGRLATALSGLGFCVHPSEANFIWVTHPTGRHREIYEQLKERRILVRYMRFPDGNADVSMLDGQVAFLCYQATYYLFSGQVPGRQGSAHDSIPTYIKRTYSDLLSFRNQVCQAQRKTGRFACRCRHTLVLGCLS